MRGWLWPLAIVLLICSASAKPTVAGPRIANFDKLVHFGVYGLLATLVCRQTRGARGAAWSLLAVSAFGATDEIHQYFVPGRYAEVADWVADTLGAAVAVLAYTRWTAYRACLERPLGWGRP
jgi:VanZ family protein